MPELFPTKEAATRLAAFLRRIERYRIDEMTEDQRRIALALARSADIRLAPLPLDEMVRR